MARDRFIKTRSNYVIKELHQNTNIGNIYERDFMTISDLNSYVPGSLPAYGLNGFKMVVNDGINLKKKHHYGNWIKNDACGTKSMYWSMQCMEDDGKQISNSSTLKPNLNSVLDFACYGSAYKMIESAVKNIINTYPGELYFTNNKVKVGDFTYYIVDNPFNIEMDRTHVIDEKLENPMRVFCESYEKYDFIDDNGVVGGNSLSWNINFFHTGTYIEYDSNGEPVIKHKCLKEGDKLSAIDLGYPFGDDKLPVRMYYVVYNGKKVLVHDGSYIDGRICPKNKVKKEFFNNLKDFEKVILNKKTNYTAILETPKETDRGNIMHRKSYTWPKTMYGDWNIDVTSNAFYNYFSSLLEIGEFYDKFHANNIWRSMTHEAIINFDWTLTHVDNDGFTTEQDTPHSERIQSFIHVAGRMFDNLKQYIDGIANVNAVTYDECNNKPDVFLFEELENYGWAVKNPLAFHLSKFISEPLYPSHADGYTVEDANFEFYRRLLLNSRAILAAKGTKRSIEMVMALFGYYSLNFLEHTYHEVMRDGDIKTVRWNSDKANVDCLTEKEKKKLLTYSYDMSEYVYVAGSGSTMWNNDNVIEEVKNFNKAKYTYDFDDKDEYQGLPLREVNVAYKNPEYSYKVWNTDGTYTIQYLPDYRTYLIPWFDKNKAKNDEYDSSIYFEGKGGWGLKQTTIGQFNDYDDIIIDTTNDLKIYDESVKYLKFVQTVEDLRYVLYRRPKVNDVYYVYDLTGAETYDWGYLTKQSESDILIPEPLHTMSHYFVLKDVEATDILGVMKDENGIPQLVSSGVTFNENHIITGMTDNVIVDENGFPVKKYGWKNVSEDELTRGKSEDAKRVYYLESIIENSEGNNPHVGYGDYDDGNTYKNFFSDVFRGANENEVFIDVDDSETPQENAYGFSLDKQIDNVKTWYFEDTLNEQRELVLLDAETNISFGYTSTMVGDFNDFVRGTKIRQENGITIDGEELFNSRQYSLMEPYNMEEDGELNDEAAANSIINTKQFYIEFVPDMSSPEGMYDFIENSIMHYVKQVIPSTTILKYYVPMRDMDVNCYHRTYLQSVIIGE